MGRQYCTFCMSELGGSALCPKCGLPQDMYTPQPSHLPPDTILAGRYVVGRALGDGGFGITYLGRDTRLNTKVAIKEYYPVNWVNRRAMQSLTPTVKTSAQESYLHGKERFIREAQAMARMEKQAPIVSVRDFFEANGTAYIIMEYVSGITLKHLVTENGRMSAQVLLPLMKPLMRALETMHQAGLIHRDISPDNLMIENGKLRLLDFGCAKEVTTGDAPMTVMLKQGFSPIEQYQEKGQGPWTDVYALSATIYYCLTATVPPPAVERLPNDGLIPPRQLGADLTAEQEQALLMGLAVRKDERFARVIGLYNALYQETFTPDAEENKVYTAPNGEQADTGRRRVRSGGRQTARRTGSGGNGRTASAKTLPGWFIPAMIGAVAVIVLVIMLVVILGGSKSSTSGSSYSSVSSSGSSGGGTVVTEPDEDDDDSSMLLYSSSEAGFTIRYPSDCTLEEDSADAYFSASFSGEEWSVTVFWSPVMFAEEMYDTTVDSLQEDGISVTIRSPEGSLLPDAAYVVSFADDAGTPGEMYVLEGANGVASYMVMWVVNSADADTSVCETMVASFTTGADSTTENGLAWYYNSDSAVLTITGSGEMDDWEDYTSCPWESCSYYAESIVIGDGITSIGDCAFYCFWYVTSVSIPDSVTRIGDYAFYDCEGLTSITIPAGVTMIGDDAFSGCESLSEVYYDGTASEWSSISIGSGNEPLTDALIYCSDGTVNESTSYTASAATAATDYFSVTFPDALSGMYEYEVAYDWDSECELVVYHTASKNAGVGGWVFSIAMYADSADYVNLPAYYKMGTITVSGSGTYDLLLIYPTDVEYSESTYSGYHQMYNCISGILSSFSCGSGCTLTASKYFNGTPILCNYILPSSSKEYLTEDDLAGLTAEELRLARNEIYARYGRRFSDSGLQAYFDSCSWYSGTIDPDDFDGSLLNDYDLANLSLIQACEDALQ